MQAVEKKYWRRLVPKNGAGHAARVALAPGRISRPHTHDFAEIFWVERGAARHETDGIAQILGEGSLVGVRPERCHRLDAPAKSTGTIFNLAFPASRLRALEAAHPKAMGRLFGARGGPCPVLKLPEAGLLELRAAGDVLLIRPPDALEVDYRILQALHWAAQEPSRPPAVPDWLARGLDRMAQPGGWEGGLATFHRVCGRSPSQVARVMLATLDTTPIAYLNRLRMAHAERQLRLTARPIVDVAAECGFAGLAQFYRLFSALHGQSPGHYRRIHQGIVR